MQTCEVLTIKLIILSNKTIKSYLQSSRSWSKIWQRTSKHSVSSPFERITLTNSMFFSWEKYNYTFNKTNGAMISERSTKTWLGLKVLKGRGEGGREIGSVFPCSLGNFFSVPLFPRNISPCFLVLPKVNLHPLVVETYVHHVFGLAHVVFFQSSFSKALCLKALFNI